MLPPFAKAAGPGHAPHSRRIPESMTNSMREPRPRTVCVGEATVEFVRGGDGRFGMPRIAHHDRAIYAFRQEPQHP